MAMLQVKNLSVFYGKIQALNQVSLTVHPGEIVALVGANGAGKSTLIWSVAGVLVPAAGEILLNGKKVPPEPHIAAKLGIALSPERRRLFPNLTVRENLLMGAYLRTDAIGIRRDEESMYELFPVLGVRRNQYAGTLSGGEQQMLAIARALMRQPQLLLLDEPSLGLSPLLTSQLFDKIAEVNDRGVTILLSEQNAFKALSIAHRAYVLESGRITMEDSPDNLLHNAHVQRAYLGVRQA